MMWKRIGCPPISTIGLGLISVSSARREPKPPARIKVFTTLHSTRDRWPVPPPAVQFESCRPLGRCQGSTGRSRPAARPDRTPTTSTDDVAAVHSLSAEHARDRRAHMQERDDDTMDRSPDHFERPDGLSTVTAWLKWGAQLDPDAPAVHDENDCLTHREFDDLTDRVAADLVRHGVQPGDRVGLCIDRSLALVAGLVGIIKCGAAYVPLDPTYPRDRLEVMQQDAALALTLVSARHHEWIADAGAKVRIWEELADGLEDHHDATDDDVTTVDAPVDPEQPVFIVFTSGSTGRPKGVELPHRAIANLVEWQLARRSFRPAARLLQYSSISFDVSLQEIASTLASGGHLFMVPDEQRRDARQLLRLLDELRIERLFLPFVALRSLVEVARHGDGL